LGVTDIFLIFGVLATATALFHPRLLRRPAWRATVTPLASIIGSGFLVAGPILQHAAGSLAWAAMLGLCALAWVFGSAIRHNIRFVEPALAEGPDAAQRWLERGSNLVLAIAYFISVAYYLNLLAAFALRLFDITDTGPIRLVSSAVIIAIGALGATGGLKALERVEIWAVALKLALIAGLFAALLAATGSDLISGDYVWPDMAGEHGMTELRTLLGLVILVQGFETSRYLGKAYDSELRIRTMRWAQALSTAIYVAFVLLITPWFQGDLPAQGGETAIIDILRPVAVLVAPLLILTALSSQLSAAVADTNGSGGLLAESLSRWVNVRTGNLATAAVALGLTWTLDIFEIIAWASRVFVAYYALQSLQASLSAWRRGKRAEAVIYGVAVLTGAVIVVFAIPAEA